MLARLCVLSAKNDTTETTNNNRVMVTMMIVITIIITMTCHHLRFPYITCDCGECSK